MAGNACWGVELGAGAIKAVKLVRDGEGVKVVDFAILPHKKVLSMPEVDEKEAKRAALGAFVSQVDLNKAKLAISVAGHSAFARFAKLPPVEASKIPDIVKFEAVQQIPFPIDDVQWDYQTFVRPDQPDEVEVGIFAITTEKCMEKLAKWQDVGRMPEVLTLSPLAAYNAVAFDQGFTEQTPGTVILDIGTTSTDLIIAEGGRIWIRTFPIGGHNFTEALISTFNLSYSKAEKLKKEAETASAARHVLQALRPVFTDLAQDVQRSIGYYQSLHRNAKLTRVIGLGATFNLPGLRKFLSQQLGIEVTRLEGFQRIKMDGERNTELQANAMSLATATGLALQGLDMEMIAANLVPAAVVRAAMWKQKTPWFMAAAGVGLAACGAMFIGWARDRASVSGGTPTIVEAARREAKVLKDQWQTFEGEFRPDTRAIAAMGLLDDRSTFAKITDDFGQIMNAIQLAIRPLPDHPPEQAATRVTLREFSTDYAYGAASAAGGDRGEAPVAPVGVDGAAGAGGEAKPRIRVTMRLQMAMTDREAEAFLRDTVRKWLETNAKRPDIGYEYEVSSFKLEKVGRDVVGQASIPQPPGGGGGGPAQPPDAPPRGGPAPGAPTGSVDQLAPLPPAPPVAPPGTNLSTYGVTFEAILTKPAQRGQEAQS
ncbi:MAG: type IV pilus assembly protein PilM [Phycisphaerales bacterium]